ncbi:hypothetical protein BU15DRAFT_65244 [Melanogaster broomeanus]|nr:hypothetical protein BU15DRAFT_65244 [Melanogaster broomeanus]
MTILCCAYSYRLGLLFAGFLDKHPAVEFTELLAVAKREVDELLDSEEVGAENAQAPTQDPAILAKFQILWRKLWPADAVEEWLKKPGEPARRGPCSRWRAFQIHQISHTLNLSSAATEALARQLESSITKVKTKKPKRSISIRTPVMPSSMRLLQQTSRPRRSRSPHFMSAPAREAADVSRVADGSQMATKSTSHKPTYLRIKLPALSRRPGEDVGPSAERQAGVSHPEVEHRSSVASRSDLPHSPPRTPEEPLSPNLVWPPDARSISMAVSEPSYEPPPVEPVPSSSEPPPHTLPEKSSAAKDTHSLRTAKRSPQQADILARDEEIASLIREVSARERDIASLRQEIQALDNLPNAPSQLPVVPSSSRAPVSENENATRRYLALQYIARTLRGARERSASQEERDALLVRAERHLARLANLEMEGIWGSDVDSDEFFTSLARDGSGW